MMKKRPNRTFTIRKNTFQTREKRTQIRKDETDTTANKVNPEHSLQALIDIRQKRQELLKVNQALEREIQAQKHQHDSYDEVIPYKSDSKR